MKKLLATLLISVFSISCATVSKMDKKNIQEINNDRAVEEILESRKPVKTDKKNMISVYQGAEKIGEFTIEEFTSIIKASSYHENILEAEKKKRVYVFFKDDPWKLTPGKAMETEMYIIWKTDKDIILKKLALKMTVEIPKEGKVMSRARIMYRNIAEIGFPVSLVVLALVLGLVFGL